MQQPLCARTFCGPDGTRTHIPFRPPVTGESATFATTSPFSSSYRNRIGLFRVTDEYLHQHTHELFCLSGGTRTHIELFSSFLIPNQGGGQLPTHLVILSGRSESNRLTDGSRPPVLKTLVTSRFNLTYKYTTSFFNYLIFFQLFLKTKNPVSFLTTNWV